uniref:Uncharacterized protein n=1 Tax=Populus trichocarpa TaxID=3694 RepID=A9PI46_POPTR|nr:unknown [Populus trichocarpa]
MDLLSICRTWVLMERLTLRVSSLVFHLLLTKTWKLIFTELLKVILLLFSLGNPYLTCL